MPAQTAYPKPKTPEVIPPKAAIAAQTVQDYAAVHADAQAELKTAQMGAIDETQAQKIAELTAASDRAKQGVHDSYAEYEKAMKDYTGPAADPQHDSFIKSLGVAAGPSYVADAMNKYADPNTYGGMMKAVAEAAQYHRDQNVKAGKKEVDDEAAKQRTDVELQQLSGSGGDSEQQKLWVEENYNKDQQNREDVIAGLMSQFGLSRSSAEARTDGVLKSFDPGEKTARQSQGVADAIAAAVGHGQPYTPEAGMKAQKDIRAYMKEMGIKESDVYAKGELIAAIQKAWESAWAARDGGQASNKGKSGFWNTLGRALNPLDVHH